jgi:hypothetical protein
MSTRQSADVPVVLSATRRQLEHWRSRQSGRKRLPQELWAKAVALAREHGINQTARALGLKYDSLKKRVERTAPEESGPEAARGEFLELLPRPTTASSIECTIEWEDPGGTTMRMHVKGATMADLASFAGGLRSGRP